MGVPVRYTHLLRGGGCLSRTASLLRWVSCRAWKRRKNGDHLGIYGSLSVVDARNGARSYAATGYLAPNLHRSNLKVLTEATVSKILLDSEAKTTTPTARGVEFVHADTVYQVAATTEVLLCAGTIASPRVVDASVFPTQISGNIMVTVYAVAEKASEVIREDRTRG